jgi:glycerol-3-phosphate dehydrogenase (NAD(P)+)
MKALVIGPGRWGTFIAWYLDTIGIDVTLYGRESSDKLKALMRDRKNSILTLGENVKITTSLAEIENAELVVISIASQSLRALLGSLAKYDLKGKKLVLCMKGIEIESGKRLTEIVTECLGENTPVAVWIGPGHVEEFTRGRPNCMVIDSRNDELKHELVDLLQSNLIRFYYGTDLIGNEIGAAAKNVIGIAAGVLDGLGLSSLKGALMARAPREISRLIEALGGSGVSAYGLCHLGDYEATLFSEHSHNRKFGEMLITGEKPDFLAEGYYTVKALVTLGERYNVDLPICRAVYNVLYNNSSPKEEMSTLFSRSLKYEF